MTANTRAPAFDLDAYMRAARSAVDDALDRMLPPEDAQPPLIHRAMRYALFAGGKRLRPILVVAGCETAGGQPEDAMPFACAVECVHTYSLVHDDLPALDNDDLRRGRATVHKMFDEATAILAGDALLTFAIEAALRPRPTPHTSGFPGAAATSAENSPPHADLDGQRGIRDHPKPAGWLSNAAREGPLVPDRTAPDPSRTLRALRVLMKAIGTEGMIGGQVSDLLATGTPADEANVRSIHERKTGALLRACPLLGGILAGAPEDTLTQLEAYGADIGLAFQVIDDILDIEGTPDRLGKSAGKDQAAGKATFPAAIGIDASRELAEDLSARAAETARAFGPAGQPLVALAAFAVERTR